MTRVQLSEAVRDERLRIPATGRIPIVLDTDTYNEIDDQFALVYGLLAPERLDVQAVYAAPFYNDRVTSPEEGMEKSYEEIHRVLDRLNVNAGGLVFRGSPRYLADDAHPVPSEAASHLVEQAMARTDSPLYVVAIGAITDVSSAILLEPRIVEKIVVVWLGGHAYHWPSADDFNLRQDPLGARLLFDCGVPLVHIPCQGVASHLSTTVAEIEAYVRGRGAIGDYLADIFATYQRQHGDSSKVLWDIATIAFLLDQRWVPTRLAPSPILAEDMTWRQDPGRHAIRYAYFVDRAPVFADLFRKLEALKP